MGLGCLIPKSLMPVFNPILQRYILPSWIYRNLIHRNLSLNKLHSYWRQPWDCVNRPQGAFKTVNGETRSVYLVNIIKKYAGTNADVLEIGSHVGKTLNSLFLAGYRKLNSVEISEEAVQLFKKTYPETADNTKVYNLPLEGIIKKLVTSEYDIVFAMAVFAHIHTKSEWVFPEIVRIIKHYLIIIDDEGTLDERHFPRNYKKVFEQLGMKQVEEIHCEESSGCNHNYITRIFKKI